MDVAGRKIWSREKNWVSKIIKISLLEIVPEGPCLFKFKNESLGDPLLNMRMSRSLLWTSMFVTEMSWMS